jgi:hypothetical protein
VYTQEGRQTKPVRQALLILLDLVCAFGCGFAAFRVAPPKPPWDQLMILRAAGFIVLLIATIYFYQRGMRLAFRMQSDRAVEYYAKKAPMSLGIKAGQTNSREQVDDGEI